MVDIRTVPFTGCIPGVGGKVEVSEIDALDVIGGGASTLGFSSTADGGSTICSFAPLPREARVRLFAGLATEPESVGVAIGCVGTC